MDTEMTAYDLMLDERRVLLRAALVQAQKAAKEVAKDSENTYHKYNYASAEAMIAESRDALGKCGLALISSWTVSEGRVHVTYTLIHEKGGAEKYDASSPIIPEKGRPLDRAEATALTYNLGYFLRGLLLLPRVEKDAEVDTRDDRHHDPMSIFKEQYESLVSQLSQDQQQRVTKWLQSRGESAASYTTAINSMRKQIAENEHTQTSGI